MASTRRNRAALLAAPPPPAPCRSVLPPRWQRFACGEAPAARRRGLGRGRARILARRTSGAAAEAGAFSPVVPRGDRHAAVHHGHELLEVDLPIAVPVDVAQQLRRTLGAHALGVAFVLQQGAQLLHADLTITVQVEDFESRPTRLLRQVAALIQGGGDELGVIDDTAAIGVDAVAHLLQVGIRLPETSLVEASFQFGDGEQSIAIRVQRCERVAQAAELAVVQLTGDDLEGRLLQLVLRPEAP
mmetsp:Transcript_103949/g.318449  ORF Transcript_103949/g.318449 Transcript_103949/m.318449 type:complete len:244 (-) Transcript_103949:1131-1862(-)